MGTYVEQNLTKNETIIKKADLNKVSLVVKWVTAAIFVVVFVVCLVILNNITNQAKDALTDSNPFYNDDSFIEDTLASTLSSVIWILGLICIPPVLKAITATLRYFNTELAITNKRVVGKVGVINTKAMDSPLDKIQNVSVSSGLFGKIFHYGKVTISLASFDTFSFDFVVDADAFKRALMQQIEQYEQDKIDEQAERTANAMSRANNAQ